MLWVPRPRVPLKAAGVTSSHFGSLRLSLLCQGLLQPPGCWLHNQLAEP